MTAPTTWRAVSASGDVREIPTPRWVGSRFKVAGEYVSHFGTTERDAACKWAIATISDLVEVRGPGELTTAEQVAAERERCARIVERERALWEQHAMRMALLEVCDRIAKPNGEEVPRG